MVAGVKIPGIGEGFWILSDFRKLSFSGSRGPCFNMEGEGGGGGVGAAPLILVTRVWLEL